MAVATTVFRWIAVPIAIGAILASCVLLANYAVSVADGRCEQMVAGSCVESWHSGIVEWSIYIGVVAGLLAVTILPACIAPALKRTTAVIAGILGSAPLWAGYFMTNWSEILFPAMLSVVAAVIGIVLVWRWQKAHPRTLS